MPRIIDRYLILEVLRAFAAISGVLLLVVVSMLLLRVLEEANLGALNADLVLRFLSLEVARQLASLVPPAFFLAILIAYGRLSRDSELIALSAGGIGTGRLYLALVYGAVALAALTAWLALEVKPWAAREIQLIRVQQKDQGYQIAGLQAGRFYQQFNGDVTLYIGEIDDKRRLRHVFIHDRRGSVERLVMSDIGHYQVDEATGDHLVTLLQGRRYDGRPGAADYAIGEFETYRVWIEARTATLYGRKRSMMPTGELLGSHDPEDRAELESRLAPPLAIFTLALIAVPLGVGSPRQRNTGRILLAFLTYFSFFNLQRLAETWLQRGVTPPWLGSLWYQLLILAVVCAILLSDSYWLKRVQRRLGLARAPGGT
jgi:lipopolysaccharide export system permease protein